MSILLWTGIILGTFYVVQKPGLLRTFSGLVDTLWTPITAALLLFNAYSLGTRILFWLRQESMDETDRLLLGTGIGLGALGLLGLAFSAIQFARAPVFFLVLTGLTIFFVFQKDLGKLRADFSAFRTHKTKSEPLLRTEDTCLCTQTTATLAQRSEPLCRSSSMQSMPPMREANSVAVGAMSTSALRSSGLWNTTIPVPNELLCLP